LKKAGKVTGDFRDYWKPLNEALIAKRESEKGPIIKKRANELKTKV
jgi:hypothetical protein